MIKRNLLIFQVVFILVFNVSFFANVKDIFAWKTILAVSFEVVWLLFANFYLTKNSMAKQQHNIDKIITQLKKVGEQFEG